jgi:hypothetical protein
MDDRLTGALAGFVGLALAVAGTGAYLLPGVAAASFDPFATGLLVVAAGLALLVAGILAARAALDHLALRAATGVAAAALLLAATHPESLLFGGVFWLALVAAGLVTAGAYRTVATVR